MGKVMKLVSSSDGSVRSAKVMMPSGRVFGRPLNLLFPIEVSSGSKGCVEEEKVEDEVSKGELLPQRQAAKEATEKIKKVFKCLNVQTINLCFSIVYILYIGVMCYKSKGLF